MNQGQTQGRPAGRYAISISGGDLPGMNGEHVEAIVFDPDAPVKSGHVAALWPVEGGSPSVQGLRTAPPPQGVQGLGDAVLLLVGSPIPVPMEQLAAVDAAVYWLDRHGHEHPIPTMTDQG